MTTFLAGAAVLIWLAGIGVLATFMPQVIRSEPMLGMAADQAPVLFCVWFAVGIVAWPALPIVALLTKLTGKEQM